MDPVSIWLSILAVLGFIGWCVVTVLDKRHQRRLRAVQEESERRWPLLAVEDFTEDDEIAPGEFRTGGIVHGGPPLLPSGCDAPWAVPRVKAHVECFDLWIDGKRPCSRCEQIFEVKA